MGRIFEVRKSKMFARYDRMAKQFTRYGKEIVMAVKNGGPDPDNNPTLRRVIQNAKGINMPKDRIEAAIKRAGEKNVEDYAEVIYEGVGPHGAMILVETATDNPTRTVANVRTAFNKGGGNLGNAGSVNYLFDRKGVFKIKDKENIDPEEMELELIDFGLEELGEDSEDNLVITTSFQDFGKMQSALEERKIVPESSELEWMPTSPINLSDEQSEEVFTLIHKLEEDDDVQKVYHNMA